MKLKRRLEHALSDSGSAQQLFAIVVLTCEKERYMIKRTATVLTMIAALATTAVAWAGPVSASSSQDDDDLPRFGPGNQYRPVIEAKDFSPNVTNRWLPLEPGTSLPPGVVPGARRGPVQGRGPRDTRDGAVRLVPAGAEDRGENRPRAHRARQQVLRARDRRGCRSLRAGPAREARARLHQDR